MDSNGPRDWESASGTGRRRVSLAALAAAVVLSAGGGFVAGRIGGGGAPATPDASPLPSVRPPSEEPEPASPPPIAQQDTRVRVPRVTGLTVREARLVLGSVGLRASLDGSEERATPRSRVWATLPVEGSWARRGSFVGLRTDASVTEDRTPCGNARVARRPYGAVIVGATVEVRTADAGQFLVMDLTSPPRDLRLRLIRRQGRHRLWFDDLGERSRSVLLSAEEHRTAPGWPPHWGVGGTITGPGCWRLRINGPGTTESVPFEVTDDALRSWR